MAARIAPLSQRQMTASRPVQDLTGKVAKTNPFCFAWGGYADIFKAEYMGFPVAVKIIKGSPDSETFDRRLRREVMVWSRVHHPNILPLLGICSNFDRPNMPGLVSPYYRHGSITNYLKDRPNVNKLPLLMNIASGLSYLHSVGVIHGDVKGSNILINDNGDASIADYGLSRILERSGFTTKTQSATWRYAAPELFHEEEVISRVTMATDVWAFSMTVVEVFTGSTPFPHIKRDGGVILFVVSGGRPKRGHCLQINDYIWAMLEPCWDAEPTRRPSMATLSQYLSSQVMPVAVENSPS